MELSNPITLKDWNNSYYSEKPIFEEQYAQLLLDTLTNGVLTKNRTGVDTFVTPMANMHFKNISTNFPIIKGKKVYPKLALKELMWMLNGRTDIKWLKDRKVNYWDAWEKSDGTIGPSYGKQFRSFNGDDSFKSLISEIVKSPTSRRAIINLWNHSDLKQMSLPPCFVLFKFFIRPVEDSSNNYKISLHVFQRSTDTFLGLPYDMMFMGWLLNIVCKLSNQVSEILNKHYNIKNQYFFTPEDIFYNCSDFHIYKNHVEQVEQYISNVKENKINIIRSKAICQIPEFSFDSEETSFFSFIDYWLKKSDESNYDSFKIKKEVPFDVYGEIKAQIAI
jgi:thymidylate synthase